MFLSLLLNAVSVSCFREVVKRNCVDWLRVGYGLAAGDGLSDVFVHVIGVDTVEGFSGKEGFEQPHFRCGFGWGGVVHGQATVIRTPLSGEVAMSRVMPSCLRHAMSVGSLLCKAVIRKTASDTGKDSSILVIMGRVGGGLGGVQGFTSGVGGVQFAWTRAISRTSPWASETERAMAVEP